jgi:hypothetical protein
MRQDKRFEHSAFRFGLLCIEANTLVIMTAQTKTSGGHLPFQVSCCQSRPSRVCHYLLDI